MNRRVVLTFAAVAGLVVGAASPAAAASSAEVSTAATGAGIRTGQTTVTKVTSNGGFSHGGGTLTVGPAAVDEVGKIENEGDWIAPKKGLWMPKAAVTAAPSTSATPPAPAIPTVSGSRVIGAGDAKGVGGISGTEMRYATSNGFCNDLVDPTCTRWNWSLEPPDMALCVGNGYVVQGVNGAVQVRDTKGNALTDVTPANAFVGWPAEYPAGPGIGDPRCQYDPQSHRFFMTWYINFGMNVLFGTLLAVSTTSNPLDAWSVYELQDLGGGLPENGYGLNLLEGCQVACFADYPQLGLDANGVWMTANEFDFGQDPSPYAGVTVLALSKSALVSGSSTINGVAWGLGYSGAVYNSEPLAFTVQPASTPSGGYDRSSGGTQYLMATRDMWGTVDNVLDVWSVTHTSYLNSGHGSLPQLNHTQVVGQSYACDCLGGAPAGGATQKDGVHPLVDSYNQPVNKLDTNDDRMHQVTYANGMLWGAASTAMNVRGSSAETVGVAWWTIKVGDTRHDNLQASIYGQGYVGVKNSFAWFPALAVGRDNSAVMAMTFSGPDRYPSTAYVTLGARGGTSSVHVAAAGVAPADGFTGVPKYSRNGTERWGDYSAAAADERGRIWFATEMIGKNNGVTDARGASLNWGTWIGWVNPD